MDRNNRLGAFRTYFAKTKPYKLNFEKYQICLKWPKVFSKTFSQITDLIFKLARMPHPPTYLTSIHKY
jgi:hypothetical protein